MADFQARMMGTKLIPIGYWSDGPDSPWPDPRDMVDTSWSPKEREDVVDYLRDGMVARAFLGYSMCRICGIQVGNLELTDGT